MPFAGNNTIVGRPKGGAAIPIWWLTDGVVAANVQNAYDAALAASYTASLSNLNKPGTLDATEGEKPGWAAGTGWTFDGSQWLDTNTAILTTGSIIIQFTGAVSGITVVCGIFDGNPQKIHRIFPDRSNSVYYGSTSQSPGMTSGVLCLAGMTGYRDGAFDKTSTTLQDSPSTYYIGAQHQDGAAVAHWTGNVQRFASYNTILTAQQVAAITSAMQDL